MARNSKKIQVKDFLDNWRSAFFLIRNYISHLNRLQLSEKYKKTVEHPLTIQEVDEVKMAYQDYKAIFAVYLSSIGIPILCFIVELVVMLNWKKVSFRGVLKMF